MKIIDPILFALFSASLITGCAPADQEAIQVHSAIQRGDIKALQRFIDGGVSVEKTDSSGRTPLYTAALYGEKDIAKYLLSKGANPKQGASWKGNETPLHAAARSGNNELIVVLLDAGVDPNIRSDSAKTPLHLAAWGLHADTVKLLVDRGADVNARDKMGNTPLIMPAPTPTYIKPDRFPAYRSILKTLVGNGGNVNASSYTRGDTPLICAAWVGDTNAVQLLMSAGADIHHKSKYGGTALEHAQRKGHKEAVSLLQNYGKKQKIAQQITERDSQ
ncbi:MAG: ankyrin repeat domain-containing protein [Kiritimatiellia bacterium]